MFWLIVIKVVLILRYHGHQYDIALSIVTWNIMWIVQISLLMDQIGCFLRNVSLVPPARSECNFRKLNNDKYNFRITLRELFSRLFASK